jgi:hypothetical protein
MKMSFGRCKTPSTSFTSETFQCLRILGDVMAGIF